MREITARVYWEGKFFYFTIGQLWNTYAQGIYAELCINGVKWEQSSGINDKNDIDIYDGDILQSVGAHRDKERKVIVSWCDEDAKFEAMPIGCVGRPWDLGALNPRFWEVIGNVHENPELAQ